MKIRRQQVVALCNVKSIIELMLSIQLMIINRQPILNYQSYNHCNILQQIIITIKVLFENQIYQLSKVKRYITVTKYAGWHLGLIMINVVKQSPQTKKCCQSLMIMITLQFDKSYLNINCTMGNTPVQMWEYKQITIHHKNYQSEFITNVIWKQL
jgi:hypothetical protein